MNDLISRRAALNALGEEPPVWYDGEDEIAERDQWRRDVAAIKALPSAQPSATDTNVPIKQPGWIPCSRELPKPNEEDGNGFHKAYLVQDGRWMDVARWNGKYWVAWGYSTVLLNVVAWCELPKPYREGGQDNG